MNSKVMGKDCPFEPRQCIFAANFDETKEGDEDRAIRAGKEFITRNQLTSEDVKMVKDGEQILVVTKKEVFLKS